MVSRADGQRVKPINKFNLHPPVPHRRVDELQDLDHMPVLFTVTLGD